MNWQPAPDIYSDLKNILAKLPLDYISPSHLFTFRSTGSSGRATARIWSLPAIWQQALQVDPGYCIEVISERYDKLSRPEQLKVLIHELLHIPKSFSGALVAHRSAHHRSFRHYHDQVEALYKLYIS